MMRKVRPERSRHREKGIWNEEESVIKAGGERRKGKRRSDVDDKGMRKEKNDGKRKRDEENRIDGEGNERKRRKEGKEIGESWGSKECLEKETKWEKKNKDKMRKEEEDKTGRGRP